MDAELLAVFRDYAPQDPVEPILRRGQIAEAMAARNTTPSPNVRRWNVAVPPSPNGRDNVRVRLYEPAGRRGTLPAILYIHGGGFTTGTPELYDFLCDPLAEDIGAVVASPDYRLAPEHPFPAGPEDCYSALVWLAGAAGELGIDPGRIAVVGTSSGGGFAAAVALMARDRGAVPLAFQMALNPCLDDRHLTASSHEIVDRRAWNRAKSIDGWQSYLGPAFGGDVHPYAAPARAGDLRGLPPAYLSIGTLDPMRDETVAYAARLLEAGVPTELHVYPGAFHGFDVVARHTSLSRDAIECQTKALLRALS
jgi:acetyl esterase/lipase